MLEVSIQLQREQLGQGAQWGGWEQFLLSFCVDFGEEMMRDRTGSSKLENGVIIQNEKEGGYREMRMKKYLAWKNKET